MGCPEAYGGDVEVDVLARPECPGADDGEGDADGVAGQDFDESFGTVFAGVAVKDADEAEGTLQGKRSFLVSKKGSPFFCNR